MHKGLLEESVYGLNKCVRPFDVGFLYAKYVGVEVLHGLYCTTPLKVVVSSREGVHIFGDDAKSCRIGRWDVSPVVVG